MTTSTVFGHQRPSRTRDGLCGRQVPRFLNVGFLGKHWHPSECLRVLIG